MNDIDRLILENQKELLLGVSALLISKCRFDMDANGETRRNVFLNKIITRQIEQYEATEAALYELEQQAKRNEPMQKED